MVDCGLVPPLYPVPGFLVEGGVRFKEHLYIPSHLIRRTFPVFLQGFVNHDSGATYDELVFRRVPARILLR